MKTIIKYLILSTLMINLTNCSSNDSEENQNTEEENQENPITERYKVSFSADGNIGEKHFKVIYKFDDQITEVNYDVDETHITDFRTGNADDKIKLDIEMTRGECYLKNIVVKVEDLLTNEIKYQHQGLTNSDQFIISPDMLTDASFLTNIYGTSTAGPKYNYKTKFFGELTYSAYGGLGINPSDYYDYRNDILVHRPTRGSMRIVVDTAPPNLPSSYRLKTEENAWLIRGDWYNQNSDFINILDATSTMNNSQYFNNSILDNTYELILTNNVINLKFWGDNATATIYLMRKDGTTETTTITTTNNEVQTLTYNL